MEGFAAEKATEREGLLVGVAMELLDDAVGMRLAVDHRNDTVSAQKCLGALLTLLDMGNHHINTHRHQPRELHIKKRKATGWV